MGQAKLKGSFELRKENAIAVAREKFPDSVKCNNCGNALSDIINMDVSGMQGMRLAGGAVCPACNQTTWILDGTPDAIADLNEVMFQSNNEAPKIGFELRK
jgi:Zn ribbon nucleic-acid-binding protein